MRTMLPKQKTARLNITSFLSSRQAWSTLTENTRKAEEDSETPRTTPEKQSYALKDQLKEHYKQQRSSGLHPVTEGVPTLPVPGTEPPDAYEDEDDYEVVGLQPVYQPTPPTSSKPKHRSYWKKDAMSGRYYHKHSDGTVS